MGNLALSRVRALSGLYLDGVNEAVFMRHPLVAEEDRVFQSMSARIAGRLSSTPLDRLDALSHAFMLRVGGSEPKKGGNQKKTPRLPDDTYSKTRALLETHHTLEAIAEARGLTIGTVLGHVERLAQEGRITKEEVYALASVGDEGFDESYEEICEVLASVKIPALAPVYGRLGGKYSYEEIRIARLIRDLGSVHK